MNMDALTFPISPRTLVLSLLVGVLSLMAGTLLGGCDAGGMNNDGDNFIAPSASQVGFDVTPGTPDTTQTLTLTYTELDEVPRPPAETLGPFVIEHIEDTGSPSEGTSVFNVTFSPGEEIATFSERVIFEAGSRYVTIRLFGDVGFDDILITDYAGTGIVENSNIQAFNGLGASTVEGELVVEAIDVGGAGVFPVVSHPLDEIVDFGETPVLVARIKASTDSDGPAIVRAALNQEGDLPDANSSAQPLIKEVPADGEYREYYFDFRDLFIQFDGQQVDAANISEIVLLVNDGGSLGTLERSDTYSGTVTIQRMARRPDIPGEEAPENAAPTASFVFAPNSPEIGETINFTDQSTDDGAIATREWDFGDGTTATGETPSHSYSTAGDYTVTLTVTDTEGESSTTSQTVTVTDPNAGNPNAFRGDDDGDGLITFDDFEDGIQSDEYFVFSGGGASISLTESSDTPAESSGSVAHEASIDGGTGGGFAGYGSGTAADTPTPGVDLTGLGADPYFTMYFRTNTTESFELEINLQEDQNGNGQFDGSGATDDEFQFVYLVNPNESGYTQLSIPLSDFADQNANNSGGDGALSDRIANIVFAIGNLPAGQFTFTIDDMVFSETDLTSGGGSTAQTACDNLGGYDLFFEDEFNTRNRDFWSDRTGSFQGNLAEFDPNNITYEDGKMIFTLEERAGDPNKPYTGAELRTDNTNGFYSYGCYEVRMKSAGPSGTVSSFFAYRFNPWQEIDIEIVGVDNQSMLTNIYFNEGPEGAANNDAFQVPPFPQAIPHDYDASQEFHNYAFEWLPGEIRWYRDGDLVKIATVAGASSDQIPDIEMQIMMNLWVSDAPSFAGPIDDSNFPVQSEYDWVRFYRPTN